MSTETVALFATLSVSIVGAIIAYFGRRDYKAKIDAEISRLNALADADIRKKNAEIAFLEAQARSKVLEFQAEKDRLAAEVQARLADAVASQLSNLSNEILRVTGKLDITEDQLKEANRKLDELSTQLRNQDTASKQIADDLQSRIDELRNRLEAMKKYGDGTADDSAAALKHDEDSK